MIKVSDVELEFLTGNPNIDDESALSLWHFNLKLLLITLLVKRARVADTTYTKSFRGSVEAFSVTAVDSGYYWCW